jgi:hypothetical protein
MHEILSLILTFISEVISLGFIAWISQACCTAFFISKAYKEYRKKKKSKDAADTSSQREVSILEDRELEEGQTFQY